MDGLRAMRRGAWRAAHIRLETELAANPDDLTAQGQLGSAYARAGRYADAIVLFDMAPFGEWYESKGLLDHAHALRALGRGEEAARLRLSTRVTESERSGMVTLLSAVDDYLDAGRADLAEELALEAVGAFPSSPATHAWLATVYVDQHRLDEGEAELWLADMLGAPSARSLTLRAQLAQDEGDLEEARALLDEAVKLRPDSRVVMSMRAEVERRDGNCPAALNLVDKTRFGFHEEPQAMAVEVRCLAELGYRDEAEQLLAYALAVYPRHPWVLEAAR